MDIQVQEAKFHSDDAALPIINLKQTKDQYTLLQKIN